MQCLMLMLKEARAGDYICRHYFNLQSLRANCKVDTNFELGLIVRTLSRRYGIDIGLVSISRRFDCILIDT